MWGMVDEEREREVNVVSVVVKIDKGWLRW